MNFPIPKGFIYYKNKKGEDIMIRIDAIESFYAVDENTCKLYTIAGDDSNYLIPYSFSKLATMIFEAQ